MFRVSLLDKTLTGIGGVHEGTLKCSTDLTNALDPLSCAVRVNVRFYSQLALSHWPDVDALHLLGNRIIAFELNKH